jgi:hypothetical protein
MILKTVTALFILMFILSCTTTGGIKDDLSDRLLYNSVPMRSGAVSWSPASSRIALIRNDELVIHNADTGDSQIIPKIKPLFIEWAPGSDLLIVRSKEGSSELVRMDVDKQTFDPVITKIPPLAARWLRPPDELIVFSTAINRMSIGTFVTYSLLRVDGGRDEVFFSWEAYFPTLSSTADFISGWVYPNLRPIHETVLMPQFHDPPALGPYTDFRTSDPVTGMVKDIIKMEDSRYSIPVSWSPDGSRMALTDDKGLLVVIDVDGPETVRPVNYEKRGRTPAWNPDGSRIYSGGWLVRSDGAEARQLLPGRRLAVINEKGLLLFDAFSPSYVLPDKPPEEKMMQIRDKLRILKDLLKEGLISDKEFRDRKAALLLKDG